MKVAIIGAGASGLLCASILSKKQNIEITIFEKNQAIGRKLLATGNGKANIANLKATKDDYNNQSFMAKIFEKISVNDVLDYFKDLGLLIISDEEGRVYPITESSQTILDILVNSLKDTNFKLSTCVTKINYNDNYFTINDLSEKYDYLIIASGSKAGLVEVKQSSTYQYLRDFGIKLTKLYNSLVGFKVKNNIKDLSGLRVKANVILYCNDKLIHEEQGEVIFKDNGLSGIVIMNISSYYARLANPQKAYLELDIVSNLSIDEVNDYLNNFDLIGLVHPKLAKYLVNKTKEEIIANLKSLRLEIIDTYETKFSQVICGGIDLNGINANLTHKKYTKMYCLGEALDIDGVCGGYNLLFAFQSALLAARDIIENETRNKKL